MRLQITLETIIEVDKTRYVRSVFVYKEIFHPVIIVYDQEDCIYIYDVVPCYGSINYMCRVTQRSE